MLVFFETWTDATVASFNQLLEGFITTIPAILGAIVVLLLGWLIAVFLGKLVTQFIKIIKVDGALEKTGLGKVVEQGGVNLDVAGWIGMLVKWFFIFVALMAATDILGWNDIAMYLRSVLDYIPHVIIAAIIIVVAVWAAGVLQTIVQASVGAGRAKAGNFAGAVTKWSILVFGFVEALAQLGVSMYIGFVIQGLVAMLAIAGGLAFGLGGKEQAASFLAKLRKEFVEK